MNKLLIFLMLSGCSQFKSDIPVSDSARSIPEWVYAPYETCIESQELCATGEGKTFGEAETQAKINLASIFEVKVKSDLTVHTWQSEVKQEVQQSLKESVDQVLETVQIKNRFKKEGLSYALASLDRSKASELLGERLGKIDQELEILWARRQRTNLRKITRLTLERERLNEKYSIVSGALFPVAVPYVQVQNWIESRPSMGALVLRVGQAPDWLVEKLRELLYESGFRIVKGESDKVVSMNMESIKEFIESKDKEKFTFTLRVSSSQKGEQKKEIAISETIIGRTQGEALLKVKKFFSEYLEHHLAELHLE